MRLLYNRDASESKTFELHKAFMSIANDAELAYYVMWPLFAKEAEIWEPFEPYFKLWSRGVKIRLAEDGCVLLRLHPDQSGTVTTT